MTDELIAERDALKLKAADRDEWQQVAMKVSKERDELRAKLDASERANAAFRAALDNIAAWQEGDVVDGTFDEPSSAAIARYALSSDAGRDYVSRAEVDAAWRKGMTDAAKLARDLVVDEAHNAPHNWITSDAIIDARDKRKEGAE